MILTLASGSPRRKMLLENIGYDVEVVKPRAEEIHYELFPPYTPVVNACIKADCAAERFPEKVIVAADTVIEFHHKILGKPSDIDEAEQMLLAFAGQTHEVITGVCIQCRQQKVRIVFAETSEVTFKHIDKALVKSYFEKVNPLDKAGAYGIQSHGDMIIEGYTGEIENIIGLPVSRVQHALTMVANSCFG